MGPSDVEHKEAKDVCTSTITYMMDGDVGLFADLALLAQAAALARDVSILVFLVYDTVWTGNNSETRRSLWTVRIGIVESTLAISRLFSFCPLWSLGGQVTLRTFAPINLNRSQVVNLHLLRVRYYPFVLLDFNSNLAIYRIGCLSTHCKVCIDDSPQNTISRILNCRHWVSSNHWRRILHTLGI